MRMTGKATGRRECGNGIREGYGRDWEHPSRAQTPLYKGFPRDLGRDERFLSINYKLIKKWIKH